MFAWLCCAVAPQCEPGRSFACSLLRRHTAPAATDAAVGHCICAVRLPWGGSGAKFSLSAAVTSEQERVQVSMRLKAASYRHGQPAPCDV